MPSVRLAALVAALGTVSFLSAQEAQAPAASQPAAAAVTPTTPSAVTPTASFELRMVYAARFRTAGRLAEAEALYTELARESE